MLASTGVQANGFSRSVMNSQLICRNETSQTPNQLQDDFVNNLAPVNQQSETMGCNRNLTSYIPRRFNFTRNRGKRNCKGKASNVKGNSCFYKEIVLLPGPNDTVTPRQGTKLYLKCNKKIVRGVQFPKQRSRDQVTQQVKSLCTYQCKPRGEGGGRDYGGDLVTKPVPSLGNFTTCLSPGWGCLNSAQPVRRLNLLLCTCIQWRSI